MVRYLGQDKETGRLIVGIGLVRRNVEQLMNGNSILLPLEDFRLQVPMDICIEWYEDEDEAMKKNAARLADDADIHIMDKGEGDHYP